MFSVLPRRRACVNDSIHNAYIICLNNTFAAAAHKPRGRRPEGRFFRFAEKWWRGRLPANTLDAEAVCATAGGEAKGARRG